MARIAALLVVSSLVIGCGSTGDAQPDAAIPDAAIPDAPGELARCPTPTAVPVAAGVGVAIAGDVGSTLGIFDPSVVYPAGASAGALAYSSVPSQSSIRTRIALSADAGGTWTFFAEANAPEPTTIASSNPADCPTGTCTGNLISEVASLVFDPTDPDPASRWKLFAHRYLVEGTNTLHYTIGTITVQTARDPQGPWTAPEKLFGLTSPSAYTTQGARYNASTFPEMADCIILTEPSAIALPGELDLAMGCVYLAGSTPRIRIVLARSTDHGQSWSSIARMLEPGDADCLPGVAPGASVNAPNLFVGPDDAVYVSATPSEDSGYHGCLIMRVDDLAAGHVERDSEGKVEPVRAIVADTGQFSGACTWSEGGGGYLFDVAFLTSAPIFRIFRAGPAI